jgi:hypothetical protein
MACSAATEVRQSRAKRFLEARSNFFDHPGGLLIQAGIGPQLGDADRGLIPLDYQKVARFLKPIRAPYNDSLIETPAGIDRRAFAKQWFARFD